MENEQEQLKKLAQIFNTGNVITADQVKQVLTGIVAIMGSYKGDTEKLNSDTKQGIVRMVEKLKKEHAEVLAECESKNKKLKESVDKAVEAVEKKLLTEADVKKISDKIISDKIAMDHESLVSDVLSKITIPEFKETVLDGPVQLANKLELLQGDERLKASALAGLEEAIDARINANFPNGRGGGAFRNTIGGGVTQIKAGTGVTISSTGAGGRGVVTITATGSGITDGDKGDITVSSSGSVWTIDNGAVTLAKMADMATASLLGRNTAGTGTPEVLSASTAKSLLSLNNVENTALSTWAGTANITTLGTIGTGVWNATAISLAKGGTGAALVDPGADTLMGWDDTDGAVKFLTIGSGLAYDHATHTLSASGGGGVPTAITVADESADTTCFPLFVTAATGDLGPKTNAGLAFNSATGVLTATGFSGPLTGNVTGNVSGSSGSTTGNAATATALQNARTIGGVSFDGTANITVATATGGFTVSGGNLALGTNSITMSGSIGVTGTRVTKVWTTDLESTNMPTVGGVAMLTISSSDTLTNKTLTTPVINGLPTGTGVASAATVSTLASRDANGNLSAVNTLEGYTTTATAAGTTTLTVSSNNMQYFTGSTTQTVVMPVTSTLVLGQSWWIVNLSSGAVTVNSSGGNAIIVLAANTSAEITCILTSGTNAASWNAMYVATVITSAKKLSVSNTLTLAGTDGTTMTFPSTSATIARTDAANTFTGASTASAWVLTSPTITTKISPTTDDGAPLGDTTHNFSDLFLATGAVINYQNSNVVITHSSGILTMGTGEFRITTVGTNTASVVTVGGTQTLTNKTLTAPRFASAGFIADNNGNELIVFTTTASAVNEVTFANAATGANPSWTASGGDSNIGIDWNAKGTGTFNFKGNATQAAQIRLYEDTDDGSNFTAFKVGTQSADITYTLPTAQGAADTYLKNDGSGNLSWATVSGGGDWVTISKGQLASANATLMNVSSISTNYDAFRIRIFHQNVAGSIRDVWLRFNGDTAGNYDNQSSYVGSTSLTASRETGQTKIRLGVGVSLGLGDCAQWEIKIAKPLTSTKASIIYDGQYNTGTSLLRYSGSANWNNTSSKITSITITDEDGTGVFDTGSFYILEGLVIT